MSVSEYQRHEVFKWLEEEMGPERAAIMMDPLPPVGWGDIATASELRSMEYGLRRDMHAGFAELRSKMHAMHTELLIKLFFGMVASNATLVGLVLAATRLG